MKQNSAIVTRFGNALFKQIYAVFMSNVCFFRSSLKTGH